MAKLTDFVDEFADELKAQLESDELRWGDTWRHRPRAGQEERIMNDLTDYYDKFVHAGTDFPYLKAVGNLFIGWVRIKHPEEII